MEVRADWDAFGQRQTDSGNVHFDRVHLPEALVLQAPGQTPTPQATLRSQVAQLIMANLYLGIGQGAFDVARTYTREQSRAWFASGVDTAAGDDPLIQHRYGQLWLLLRPAELLADHAAGAVDRAFDKGALMTARERGEVAVAVAEAKSWRTGPASRSAARCSSSPAPAPPRRVWLRPFLAQRAGPYPARPDRLQAARPGPLCAQWRPARTHRVLLIMNAPSPNAIQAVDPYRRR